MNFRIDGPVNEIHEIEFIIGGSCINRYYPSIYNIPLFFHNQVLPAIKCNNYTIFYDSNVEYQIKFDVVKILNPKSMYRFIINQLEFTGEEKIRHQSTEIRLGFNHPVTKVVVITPQELINPHLDLDGHILSLNRVDDHYEYQFNKTVNFSQINRPIFNCKLQDTSNPFDISIFAHCLHIMKCQNEQIGMEFSK